MNIAEGISSSFFLIVNNDIWDFLVCHHCSGLPGLVIVNNDAKNFQTFCMIIIM